MGDNRSYAALDWVIGEIGETLKQARQSLEAYVENTDDTTRIRFCLTHIHQVHGSLQMVEFYGAALLAEEMEHLAQALMNKSVRNESEAQEVLMRAILQMPIYLDQVKNHRKDNPASVLPLLNDLRAVRGESLLTETKLFTPNLAPAHHIADKNAAGSVEPKQFKVIIEKLRQMYQFAAASVIKNHNRDENIQYLNKVFARLRKLTQGTARQPLWDITLALVEGLQSDSIESSATVKNLLRQLDKEIKYLAETGVSALNSFTNDELIKNLLYYIARATHEGKHIQRIKNAYNLASALPEPKEKSDHDEIMAPDLEAIRSVVTALKDELDSIKHALDISLTDRDSADIQEALPIIKRVADTMAVLGIGDLRKQIIIQGELLDTAAKAGDVPADLLMQVAGKIIEIESSLEYMASGANKPGEWTAESAGVTALDQAQETVLRESRNGLEQAKDAIIEYIASQWNRDHLAVVPSHLREIAGGLDMVPLPKPAAILNACANYVEQQLLGDTKTPEWTELDTLADAIASVEYYLERLCGDREEEDEMLLGVAEDSVRALGYPVNEGGSVRPSTLSPRTTKASVDTVLGKMASVEEVEIAAPQESDHEQEIDLEKNAASEVAENVEVDLDELVPIPSAQVTESPNKSEPVLAQPQVEEEDSLIDDEIVEIFIEEAAEVLETINEFFPKWAENFEDQESLTEFRRAFHTLKGSGRMVNANDIGELAWAVENMLNRVIDNSVDPTKAHANLISRVVALLPAMIDAFKHQHPHPDPELAAKLSGWADELSKGEIPEVLLGDESEEPVAEIAIGAVVEEEDDDGSDSLLWEIFDSEAQTHLEVVKEFIAEMDEAAPIYTPPSDPMQRALHTLKGSAHMADVKPIAELATPLERFVKELRIYQVNIDADILQLLKDGVDYIEYVLHQIENNQDLEIPKLPQYLARVAELKERSVAPLIRQREIEESQVIKAVDPKLLSIFMAEEMKLLLDVDQIIHRWRTERFNVEEVKPIIVELKTLQEGAEHANLPPMAELSHLLVGVYEGALSSKLFTDDTFFDGITMGHAELLDMVDAVAVGQNLDPISEITLNALNNLLIASDDVVSTIPTFGGPRAMHPEREEDVEPELSAPIVEEHITEADIIDAEVEIDAEIEAVNIEDVDAEIETASETEESITFELPEIEETDFGDFETNEVVEDQDIVLEADAEAVIEDAHEVHEVDTSGDTEQVDLEVFEIFIEEAEELLEDIDNAINDWEADWADTSQVEALKRSLHTLKGGARLAGLMGMGELAHEFESFLIAKGENVQPNADFFKVVHDYQDKLINGTDKVKERVNGHMPEGLEEVMSASPDFNEAALDEPEIIEEDAAELNPETPKAATAKKATEKQSGADILQFTPKRPAAEQAGVSQLPTPAQKESAGGVGPTKGGPGQANVAARRSGPQEVIKVSAELLEELVNLAGETSISRGRLESQNAELGFAIDEMEATVKRLQEQLRRLDIETEAQMIFRQEQMQEAEDFDPLEMDRYSQLQQLSRSLMESASDLMDLTGTLGDKTRDTETLLLQQSRINTELQEGLMRSRMVPFSRMVPRLRRIVRQVATELGKHVSFELDNVEGELDRSVLERMVAPLEHMLRNAVDHGIEGREERAKTGKPETGRIVLSLGREGGDVILRLADDGRGINLDKVRQKAIERGLMSAEAPLSDHDVMQFILHAGFSTADKVSQISGRGVGMDVVHSEIKQLGGSMVIDSNWGHGTEFVIRLPFTVSVNRALMIQIGDDLYALPLNTIEGIVRVSPFELEHYYQDPKARFEYAGENYRVRYLGSMLDATNLPRLEGQALPMPVVLVRTAEHAVAIQVDRLMGSREIVVKSLGQQFSAVEGLSGATVMGDGSVVVILDPHAMIRKEMALLEPSSQRLDISQEAPKEDRTKVVMVVDDSVTVRKVTSRFLEREGFEVVTAKDGADALLILQDQVPDVMLLDIEMPRMDGFEVAKNIRSSSRLKDLPIIMITSRTGEKHRDRALSLGVNKYMGKPYQEEALLNNIRDLIDESAE